MTKIEDFSTGIPMESNTKLIEIDPAENINNKRHIRLLLKHIAESNLDNLLTNISNAYHDEAEIKAFHPINDLKGIENIESVYWRPLLKAFPDLERRDNLFIGGSFQNNIFVSAISHLTGTFTNEWLNVPPHGKTIHLRTCEVHQIEKGKIIQSHILIDTIDFIRQAGFWPINKSLGVEGMWPGPITGDGTTFENLDKKLSTASLDQGLKMQRSLNIKPENEEGATNERIREKLLDHPQKEFWHPKMMWFGPCGIGTARGLKGFVAHHQLPFRMTFKDRNYWKIGHYVELGDGNYSMTAGWHSIEAIHGAKDWLGYEPTNKSVTMRVMDFYLHNEDLIRENWVPIDIAHILYQIGVDVFELIKK